MSTTDLQAIKANEPLKWIRTQGLSLGMGNINDFIEFGSVNLRAVALGWRDSDFLNQLIHPYDGQESGLKSNESSMPALSESFGYNNPWNFDIVYRDKPDFRWKTMTPGNNGKWEYVPKNIIQLNFPKAPTKVNIRPIALTSYNNSGDQYPFTCN